MQRESITNYELEIRNETGKKGKMEEVNIKTEQTAKEKRDALTIAYKKTFAGQDGEMVYRDLIEQGFVYQECFVAGDTHGTAYALGRRSIVLMIKGQIDRKIEQ